MVVSGEHVLRPEIHERPDGRAHVREEERRVVLRHAVGSSYVHGPQQKEGARHTQRCAPPPHGLRHMGTASIASNRLLRATRSPSTSAL